MGIEVNTNRYTGVKRITVKNHDGSTAGTITVHASSLKKTKKLQYKFKRISTQIIQAKTSGSARQVLTRAKGETVSLRRKVYTGDYDRNELRRAIRHAEQMERIAKKRMKHLQQEESLEKGNKDWQAMFDDESMEESFYDMAENFPEMSKEEIRQLLQELQEELAQLEQENGLEDLELAQAVQSNMDPAQLEQLKKKHRAEELREIAEADMKYLKALFSQMERDRQEASSGSTGVSLELSGVNIPVQIDERSAAEVADAAMPASTEGGSIDISV